MSSKLVSGSAVERAQPFVWQKAGSPHPEYAASIAAQNSDTPDRQLIARIAELESQLETKARQAYQQGLKDGEASAQKQAASRFEPVIARFAKTTEEIAGLKERFRRDAEEDVARLSIVIARRILHRELQVDPDALSGIVNAALAKVSAREVHRIRVNPADAPGVQRALEAVGLPSKLEIISDGSLERGAAIFETARGNLDASVETQLVEIERGLADLVRGRR
jgi:flagellar assembly protein FliH